MPAKVRERPAFRCAECGQTHAKWMGRCPECQAWDSLHQQGTTRSRGLRPASPTSPAARIADVDAVAALALPTGVEELDRVLGGGVVPGAVVLLAGEPGVGKSTLLLEVAHRFASGGNRTLIVSGEESAAQVRLRAGRTGALSTELYLAAETDLGALLGHVEDVRPALLIVDSIQTMTHPDVDGGAGGVAQVRECAAALIRVAKERAITTVLVGHVTKDGSIAGPRVLEHLVDVVLAFEGERHATLRMVRATKNRFGPADEVGCFELTDDGIVGLPDPSGLFLSRRPDPVAGTCVTVSMEGRRPLVAEVQALVVASQLANPRRGCSGLDAARVAMLLAVLERRAQVSLSTKEVYAATVGGMRIGEPAADLAVSLALASAASTNPLRPGLVAVGEVSLTGEVRRVGGVSRRVAEAARLGFRIALVPPESNAGRAGIDVVEVADVGAALRAATGVRPAVRAVATP